MKRFFENKLRFRISIVFLVTIFAALGTHLLIALRASRQYSVPLAQHLSDVVFSGLILTLILYFGAFVWELFRHRKFGWIYALYFTVTFFLTLFFAFSWSLELEGFRP